MTHIPNTPRDATDFVAIIALLKTEQEKPRQGDDACELLDEIIKQARALTTLERSDTVEEDRL